MASKMFSQFTEKSISEMQSGGGKVVGYMDGENTQSDASELASKTYVNTGLASKIGDASVNNITYGRKNSAWVPVNTQVPVNNAESAVFTLKSGNIVASFIDKGIDKVYMQDITASGDAMFYSGYNNGDVLFSNRNRIIANVTKKLSVTVRTDSSLCYVVQYRGFTYCTFSVKNNTFYVEKYDYELNYVGTYEIYISSQATSNGGSYWGDVVNDQLFVCVADNTNSVYRVAHLKDDASWEIILEYTEQFSSFMFVNGHYVFDATNRYYVLDESFNVISYHDHNLDSSSRASFENISVHNDRQMIRVKNDFNYEVIDLTESIPQGYNTKTIQKESRTNNLYVFAKNSYVWSAFVYDSQFNFIEKIDITGATISQARILLCETFFENMQTVSDFNENDADSPAYIKNIPYALRNIPTSGNYTLKVVNGNLQWVQG